jgi:N-acetylglucosaminyldiphosphoundecaprenol N-acetyl-beta-D-mannosaminyltransferase
MLKGRLTVLGAGFDPLGRREALDRISTFLDSEKFNLVVTIGTEMVMHAQHDAEFRAITLSAPLVIPDGIGVVVAGRYRGYRVPERVTGIDLILSIAESFGPKARFYFLGSAPGIAEEAASHLRSKYPSSQVVGMHDGYFKDDLAIVDAVRESGANILLVGLGFPRQEKWLTKFGPMTGCQVGIGVGGSFDVLSGRLSRAPKFVRKVGLEWLYRLAKQPTRWRRMAVLPHFAVKVLLGGSTAVKPLAVAADSASSSAQVSIQAGQSSLAGDSTR